MKNLKKIKGLTLIEVMILMSLILGFILIFLNMDMTTNEKQNSRKVGTQLNMIVSAVDKRIAIEGKSFSYWKNGPIWSGSQFKDFLKQELVGAGNKTCGDPSKGWKPILNIGDLDPKSPEGKNLLYMYDNALSSKLIPCTLWTVFPYDILPSAKITKDANGDLDNLLLSFKFANATDWSKGFSKFNESYIFAKEQKNTTLLTTKSFYYSNTSDNVIDFKQCLALKNNCSMNLKISVGSSSTDDKKFKIDSSNSFEDNLGFAKSVKANQQIDCKIWTVDNSINPPKWSTRDTACGVTGGSASIKDKEVSLIGDNIDAQNVKITGKCINYAKQFPLTGSDYNSECGMIDNGTLIQLNANVLQADDIISGNMDVNSDTYINNLSVNKNVGGSGITASVDDTFKSSGLSLADITAADQNLSESERNELGNLRLFDKGYRIKPAESSFFTYGLKVKDFLSESESIINGTFSTDDIFLTNKFYSIAPSTINELIVDKNATLAELRSATGVSLNYPITFADSSNKLNSKDNPYKVVLNFDNIDSSSTGILLGDITAKDIQVKSGTTEQLNFKSSYKSNNLLKVSKSLNFDNLTNKYIYPKGYMTGWGAEGYDANSGVFAKQFKLDTQIDSSGMALQVNSTANDTAAYIYDQNWGFAQNYVGYRNGIQLTYDQFPDTRGMFYMNDMGKVLSSGYYDTGLATGIRIGGGYNNSGNGTGFFWGRDPKMLANEFGDKPIIANLPSSIYGYDANQDITALNNGYKMIVNNLTVYASLAANLYSGANYHQGLPKILSGSTITNVDVPVNYVSSGVGEYWETADGIFLRSLNSTITYYLNRISYIYGQYVNLNKLGTIKGSKGDRGARGQIGANGLKGETGSQGIPGAVGDRG
jgi:hypothetical protein